MKFYYIIFILLITAVFSESCSKLVLVQEPEMRVLGGKTLIEAQVLGRYRQIDESAYQISTLSGEDDLNLIMVSTNVSDELAQGYKEALIRSMFNQDEINLYKTNYYIGENNGGYLSYIAFDVSNPKTAYSEERIKYIREIINKENTDRRTIAEYLILSDPKLSMANIKEVETALYRRNIQKLINNSYYQLPDNTWTFYTNNTNG
ncbi:DUF1318 domain-containing protein [uncultured Brachyspira sp.]|uniref:DUF1318 domain-containing protein n=1 Tax=uncultured Brachyspira sp. TaxID=221953 RepID=UPI0025FF959E|nr:DUF1318 domain-containing protein [uncultured Brachyspira sp.]